MIRKSQKPVLMLFGRVPQHGVGKRRLAKGIGNFAAWQFYRRNLSVTLRALKDPRWHVRFAGTPDRFTTFKQGQGDLGDRLVRQFRSLKRPVLVVGTDIPDLTPDDIATAFKALKRGNAVMGAGEDGGFWCLGLRGRRISPTLFKGTGWSQATTGEQVRKRLAHAGFRVSFTNVKTDIDEKAAYDRWISARRK